MQNSQTGKMALDPNVLIQLFSPLVTSQRFMREQFGNPYNSLQCNDGTNIVFQDVRKEATQFLASLFSLMNFNILIVVILVHGLSLFESGQRRSVQFKEIGRNHHYSRGLLGWTGCVNVTIFYINV